MNAYTSALLLAFAATAAAGQALPPSSASPQPRLRLDPTTRTAIADPGPLSPPGSDPSVIRMDQYVVKGKAMLPIIPAAPAEPDGPFTITNGGRITRKDLGPVHFEEGLWAHVDVLAHDAIFTVHEKESRLVTGLFDFVRLSW